MKTIKALVAAASLSLLALTNAHAGGFWADAIRLVPNDLPEARICWPKAPVDPRVFEMVADVPQFQAPHILECLDWPHVPHWVDPRIIHELPRDLPMHRWVD